jgi:T5orf172 domain-containing protein
VVGAAHNHNQETENKGDHTLDVDGRLSSIRHAFFELDVAWFSKGLAKWEAQKVEKIIYTELTPFNRRFHYKLCNIAHREWFEVPLEHVKNAATRWEAFINRLAASRI